MKETKLFGMFNHLLILITIGFFVSCNQSSESLKEVLSTTTKGKVVIYLDETLQPILDSQIYMFENAYPEADLQEKYLPQEKAIEALVKGSVQMVIASRKLTPAEDKFIRNRTFIPIVSDLAKDGVALITNTKNVDTLLEFASVRELLTGKIATWNRIRKGNNLGKIQLVFDNAYSSTYSFMMDRCDIRAQASKDIYTAGSNRAVIDYVSKTPGAIGFIGVNWISDFDDSTVVNFMKKINVMAIKPGPDIKAEKGEYYQPYQAYLALGYYPFTRTLYSIVTEPRPGLATGFSSYINGPKGQLMFKKSGLVPARASLRLVKFNKE